MSPGNFQKTARQMTQEETEKLNCMLYEMYLKNSALTLFAASTVK